MFRWDLCSLNDAELYVSIGVYAWHNGAVVQMPSAYVVMLSHVCVGVHCLLCFCVVP